jgi:hypothetical protein
MKASGQRLLDKRLMRFSGGEWACLLRGCFPGSSITSDLFFNFMKTSWLTIVLLVFAASRIQGQVSQSGPPAIAGQGTVPVQDTPYAMVDRGANHRVWQRTTYETRPDGKQIPHIHKYTELATGLNFWNSTTGQWVESKEQIDILPNGTAAATQGQHQAYFPGNIYQGVIELVTPDGIHLQSRPLGLSYDDGTKTVLIAELKDSVGQLVGPNQVVYFDAFTDFKADLRFTYTKAGFEQDIILREQPLTPESFGLNPATARLQVLSEFFNPPQPAVTTAMLPKQAGITLTDENLDFGVMKMMLGRAFLLGSDSHEGGVLVSKSWVKLEGRQFLVEEVPVEALVDELAQLPVLQTASTKPNVDSMLHVASAKRLLPAPRLTKTSPSGQIKQVAQAAIPTRGLVLDYVTMTAQTNYTFQGDTTYYINGAVNLSGTNNLIEGGAVLKYASNASVVVAIGQFQPAVQFRTSAYLPVIFTAKDDNSVGEIISGSTGNPTNYYANPALSLSVPSFAPTIANFRIAYAKQAMYLVSVSPLIANGQIVNCQNGISVAGGGGTLENVLFANVLTNFNILGGASFTAQNVTFSGSRYLITQPSQYNSFSFANCIFVNVTNLYNIAPISFSGSYNGFYNSPTFGTSTFTNAFYPFQTVGGGSYYLANDSTNRNKGTTNINSNLLAQLRQKTTYPPIVYSNTTISVATTFSPQAQRDTDVPDLGYHYDPLDYVFGGVTASSNLTFTAGTAMGWFNGGPWASWSQGYGISLNGSAKATFNGTATTPCVLARNDMVQEGGNGIWTAEGYLGGFIGLGGNYTADTAPTVTLKLTHCYSRNYEGQYFRDYGDGTLIVIRATGCEFYSGGAEGYLMYLNYTNCLFVRADTGVQCDCSPSISMRNCTMQGGLLFADHWDGTTWPVWIENCAFDRTDLLGMNDNSGGNTNITYCDYNAFLTNANLTTIMGGHEVTNLVSYNWQTGYLGNFYLPTNSSLINTGSVTADIIGLYHFTTQTNQVKETNSPVDIGYHYVAVDTNGIPIDTNGDGIPDYLEDANGNGLVDSGEIGWNIFGDLGLKVLITRPRNGGIMP